MKLMITARNMTVTPAIEDRIQKKTERMGRYLLPETELQVRLRRDPNDMRNVEITVPMGNGVILRAEAKAAGNLFAAIDEALTRIERQIHRHRTKLEKKLREDAFKPERLPEYLEEEPEEESSTVVRRKSFPIRPMSEEDAAIQMELLGHSFFAFVNADTGKVNVIYQRVGGGLGLLEPEE